MLSTMNRRIWQFLVAAMHITSLASVTSDRQIEGDGVQSPQVVYKTKQEFKSMEKLYKKEVGEYNLELSGKIGSRPPNCEHKCGGCNPCYAIQVPEITEHLGLLLANYEPEGWKCKCGTSFFIP